MIVCKSCGANNNDADSFCGACGSFLEWTGQRSSPGAPGAPPGAAPGAPVGAPPPPAEPETKKPSLFERVQKLAYLDVGEREPMPSTPPPGMPGAGMPGAG